MVLSEIPPGWKKGKMITALGRSRNMCYNLASLLIVFIKFATNLMLNSLSLSPALSRKTVFFKVREMSRKVDIFREDWNFKT